MPDFRTVLRWVLIPLACVLSWYVALLLGLLTYSGLEKLCAPEDMVSGICTARWFHYAYEICVCAGAGVAAILMQLSSYCLAPQAKLRVVWLTYLLSMMAALYMLWQTAAYDAFASAALAGLLSAYFIQKRIEQNKAGREVDSNDGG